MFLMMMANAISDGFYSSSTKQKYVVKSNAEGEFVTLSDMNEENVKHGHPISTAWHRTKQIRYYFIKQYLDDESLLVHCSIEQMITDII